MLREYSAGETLECRILDAVLHFRKDCIRIQASLFQIEYGHEAFEVAPSALILPEVFNMPSGYRTMVMDDFIRPAYVKIFLRAE